jgi:2-oxoisovalerate dehydrogenase E1 component alpha subunit
MENEERTKIRKQVLQEFSEAEKMKKPPLRAMFEDVYETITPEAQGQMAELKRIIENNPQEYDVNEFDGGIKSLS